MALSDLSYLMHGDGRVDALGNADPQRSGAAISRLWLAFLDTYLKGRPHMAVTRVLAHFSNLERHDPGDLRDWARKNPDLADQK